VRVLTIQLVGERKDVEFEALHNVNIL